MVGMSRMSARDAAALADALHAVRLERQRQHEKWGRQRHGMTVWGAILAEEVGEAAQATLQLRSLPVFAGAGDRHKKLGDLLAEVTQIAAVAVAWAEHIGEAIEAGEGMPEEVWE